MNKNNNIFIMSIDTNKYYYINGVISAFRKSLHDKTITQGDVIFVLKYMNFPFKSVEIIKNGKKTISGAYKKSIIDSYLNTYEKREMIKRLISTAYDEETRKLESELRERKSKPTEKQKDQNKDKMIDYIYNAPEEDMDYMSNKLLMDDDVMYESNSVKIFDVNASWKPKKDIFLSKSPNYIAKYLRENSKDDGQAMKRLTFYMNRAGKNLQNKTVLNKVKEILRSKD